MSQLAEQVSPYTPSQRQRGKKPLHQVLYDFLKSKGGCADYEEVYARLRQEGASETTLRKKLSQIIWRATAYTIGTKGRKKVCLPKLVRVTPTNADVEVEGEFEQSIGSLLRSIVSVVERYLTPYNITIKECRDGSLIVEALGLEGRQITMYKFTFEVDSSVCPALNSVFGDETD